MNLTKKVPGFTLINTKQKPRHATYVGQQNAGNCKETETKSSQVENTRRDRRVLGRWRSPAGDGRRGASPAGGGASFAELRRVAVERDPRVVAPRDLARVMGQWYM